MEPTPRQPAPQDPQPHSTEVSAGDGSSGREQTSTALAVDLYATSIAGDLEAVVRALGSSDSEGSQDVLATAASLAAENGHVEIVRLLLERNSVKSLQLPHPQHSPRHAQILVVRMYRQLLNSLTEWRYYE